ncbi:MAG: hypothetical protein AAF642_04645 [Pseudomonadota bacterium]
MTPSALSILTDFCVAVVGFSGIVAALAYQGSRFAPLDRFRVFTLLLYALCGAFGSLAPMVAQGFGTTAPLYWQIGAGSLSLLLICSILATFMAAWRLPPADRAKLQLYVWILVVGGNIILAVWLAASAVAFPGPGPIMTAIIWQLFLSVLLFIRLILNPRPVRSE